MPEVQSLSVRHQAIMDYMLANPTVRLGEVALHFHVSQPWLSCIIHSDAFQRELREKQDVLFNGTVLPLREKMTVVAHKMLDKLMDTDSSTLDVDTAAEVGISMLDRLGFSPKAPTSLVPPHLADAVQVERERLAAARRLIGVQVSTPEGVVSVTLQDSSNASPQRIQDRLGGASREGALLSLEEAYSSSEEGPGV